MTPNLRYARTCTLAAISLTAASIYTPTVTTPWLCLPGLYGAVFLAWCARREYAFHRALLIEHERARRKAYGEQPHETVNVPCCPFWQHSDGAVHGPGCSLRLDPTAELNAACCDIWFVSRGSAHGAACSKRDHRSAA